MKHNSFLYEWTDIKYNMFYIGVHKGTTDDGYICSSKVLLEQYKKRPNDFKRKIIKFGTFQELIKEESLLLKQIDAAKNKNYYNQHNGDGNFFCKFHTEETKKIIRKKLKQHTKTKEHCESISKSKKGIIPSATFTRRSYAGEGNPNFGKKWPNQGQEKHIKFSKKYIVDGIEYLGLSEIMTKYNLKSKEMVHYRIKSKSEKFKEWKYAY